MSDDATKIIELTQGYTTSVDVTKYAELTKYSWFAKFGGNGGQPYAARSEHYKDEDGKDHVKTIRMHRQIMNCPPDKEVDHQDGNTLHNCESNLRIVPKPINLQGRFKRPPPEYNQEFITQNDV